MDGTMSYHELQSGVNSALILHVCVLSQDLRVSKIKTLLIFSEYLIAF